MSLCVYSNLTQLQATFAVSNLITQTCVFDLGKNLINILLTNSLITRYIIQLIVLTVKFRTKSN